MDFLFYLLTVSVFWTYAYSLDVVLKGDPCSKFDACYAKPMFRTCSCEDSCVLYGTCCHDSKYLKQITSEKLFQCYSHRVINPIYVKRSCADDFHLPEDHKNECLDDGVDELDVVHNLLVTSRKTKTTYWNQNCAKCNHENDQDLLQWNIKVFCRPREEIHRHTILRNLTYDQDKEGWGLHVGGEFVPCALKFTPPHYVDEIQYCIGDLIYDCPDSYENKDIAKKCKEYYGQRKMDDEGSVKFYKNIHCAICNDANVKNLKCESLTNSKMQSEDVDYSEMVEEVFSMSEWKGRNADLKYKCSKGFSYNPFTERCMERTIQDQVTTAETVKDNSAAIFALDALVFYISVTGILLLF